MFVYKFEARHTRAPACDEMATVAIVAAIAAASLWPVVHVWRRRWQRPLPLLLEHINLNVPDEAAARAFYVSGLGGAVQPKSSNWRQLHVNIGASQFHLIHSASRPDAQPPGEPMRAPQKWPARTKLWSKETPGELCTRLERQRADAGWSNRPPEMTLGADSLPTVLCECPWGNRYEVCAAPTGFVPEGAHPGGAGPLVAMRELVHPVRPGGAAAIAAFFDRILGCPVETSAGRCTVRFASGQSVRFEEADDAPPVDAYERDEPEHGYHLAFYMPSHEAFGAAFERAKGYLYVNERFEGGPPEFGNARTHDVAMSCGQFRVRDLKHPETGVLALMLELEIRSPRHVSFPLPRKGLIG